jgi:hypothetical protein
VNTPTSVDRDAPVLPHRGGTGDGITGVNHLKNAAQAANPR